jgi:hypothetical protein
MDEILALFDSLLPIQEYDNQRFQFTTQAIPNFEQHRIGKDSSGFPCLLISVKADNPAARPDPIILENLTVQHDLRCRVRQSDGNIVEGYFTIIKCLDVSRNLLVFFFRLLTPLIQSLGTNPSRSEVSNAVNTLVELFRALLRPARKTVQGLWAELYIIARSSNPQLLAAAWHTLPEDRFDFNEGDQRIEVKSNSNQLRQHYFSLDQLYPPGGARVLIASLFVVPIQGGTSLQALVDIVRNLVSEDPELVLQVDLKIGLILGENWRNGLSEKFDFKLASESYQLFESQQIPSVNPDISIDVSEVRFKSDLSRTPRIDYEQFRDVGGIFQAALPQSVM